MKSFRKISLEWLKVPKLFLANSIFKKEHNDIFPRGRLFHIHQPQKLVRVHILLWFGLRFAPADHRCVYFTTGLDGSTLIRKAWIRTEKSQGLTYYFKCSEKMTILRAEIVHVSIASKIVSHRAISTLWSVKAPPYTPKKKSIQFFSS